VSRRLHIVGTRGIPARHSGFESFVQALAPYLVERGWRVDVYCQADPESLQPAPAEWRGVRLVQVPVRWPGSPGSIVFDWKATLRSAREPGLVLQLGYNTAVFGLWYRLKRRRALVNMDGIEWRRAKWSPPVRLWFWANERVACRVAHHLVADHPAIREHLARRVAPSRITMIPYGAERVERAEASRLERFGLRPRGYALAVARIEPENSLVEIVSAFGRRERGLRLAVVGDCSGGGSYRRAVRRAAGPEVSLLGGVYDGAELQALRFFARLHVHGHQVGGTNPSLVEALGAGSPVLAHDNRFNRWVAGPQAAYFRDADECASRLDNLLDDEARLERMRAASRERHAQEFTWSRILGRYEELLAQCSAS
jgi:glycosyltransferase involved in cell wall biosynthesis